MTARRVIARILLVLLAALMLALSATFAWAAVTDYKVHGLVPKGVSIVGHDLSGMTEDQAREAITAAVSTPMLRPVTITGDKKSWVFDPKGTVSIDVDLMVNEAYSTRRSATFVTRLESQLRGAPLTNDIKPEYSVDTTTVGAWVAQTATLINRPPKDSVRTIDDAKYRFKITPEIYGAIVDQAKSVKRIAGALTAETALANADRSVPLHVSSRKPKVLASSFKTGIIVSLDQCKIYLYNGAKLVKTYPCAPGQAGYPTPTGDFKIETKETNASWFNPHAAWSASMPDIIGPGPYNPMGVRKIGINYFGVFFHGIPPGEFGSIGSHASHGCMRMFPSDVLDLYGRVDIGNPVFIRN